MMFPYSAFLAHGIKRYHCRWPSALESYVRLLNLSQTSSTPLPLELWYSSLLFCIHNNILKHSYLATKRMNWMELNWTKHFLFSGIRRSDNCKVALCAYCYVLSHPCSHVGCIFISLPCSFIISMFKLCFLKEYHCWCAAMDGLIIWF